MVSPTYKTGQKKKSLNEIVYSLGLNFIIAEAKFKKQDNSSSRRRLLFLQDTAEQFLTSNTS